MSLITFVLLTISAFAQTYDLHIFKEKYLTPATLAPFESDLCSVVPDGTKENPTLLADCCIEHDFKYWIGGSQSERLMADQEFLGCLRERVSYPIAYTMYLGVRFGGTPHSNTTYRWGYGWDQHRGYKSFSSEEYEQIEDLSQKIIDKKNHINKSPLNNLKPAKYMANNFCEDEILKYFERLGLKEIQFLNNSNYSSLHYSVLDPSTNCKYSVRFRYNVDAAFCSYDSNRYVYEELFKVFPQKKCVLN